MEFVICENCGKTMPKQISGIDLLDSMEPEKVWCSEWCLQEWEKKMKAFDKWWEEIQKGPHASLPQHKFQAELVWRASLNWVLDSCGHLWHGYRIEEELGEE